MKRIFALLGIVLLTGCSTFNKEWKTATASTGHTGINGPWQGEWRSERNNHRGDLRCVVTQTSPASFHAHFRAKWWKIFRFTYAATLTGAETNGVVTLKGAADLPKWAGGTYRYAGTASATNFSSTYQSKYDHGHYRMTRP